MRLSNTYIAGIGGAELERFDTAEAVARGWYDREEWERGGLQSITIAGATPAPDLAIEAARRAVEDSGHEPTDFCALFHTSVHPQGPHGWSARHYINRHTINQDVTCVEINNGCAGFFSCLHLAACYLQASSERTAALLAFGDNFGTPSVDRWRACPKIFVIADGGAAIVLSKRGGFAKVLAVDSASNPDLEVHHRGEEPLFPPGLTAGGTLNFAERREQSRVRALEGTLAPIEDFGVTFADAVKKTLAAADTSMDQIRRVVHDGFTREAISAIYLDRLGVEAERGIWEFTRTVGHSGPVDHVRGLEYLWKNRHVDVGDKVMLITNTPGMEAACAVLEITETP